MSQQVFVEEFETPKHAEEHAALRKISLELHRANVALILMGATEPNLEQKQLVRVASTHLLSGVNTLVSILSLTEKLSLKVKEAIALSRVFYETSLVAAFTCVGGPELARRAELYSVYKTFRNQTQVQKTGGFVLRISNGVRLSRKDPKVVAALKEFGGSSGIRPCFEERRSDMLEKVTDFDARAGLLFAGVEGMIHDVSSEIIHGSHHGYALFNSLHNGKDEMVENLSAHHEMLLFAVSLSVAGISRVLGKTFDLEEVMGELEISCISTLMPYVPEDVAAQLRTLYPE
jgi:predicted heme/steroid binding protein